MHKRTSKTITNPFLDHGYVSPAYFCDREKETAKLTAALHNGRNVTLMSPRRIGKTGLIKNVFHHIHANEPKAACIYADIFPTRNQQDLVNVLGQAIFSETKTPLEKAATILSQCRPVIGVDQFSGTPTLSFDVQPAMAEQNIRQLFDYVGQLPHECYIAIDEFQQIARYPERGTEALLRSFIQFLPNVHFIFAGSRLHLMAEMFLSAQRPFYQSTQMMTLDVIPEDSYYAFANRLFEQRGGGIARAAFNYAYHLVDGQTWYVQTILNRLYQSHQEVTGKEQVDDIMEVILGENAASYQGLLSMLTDNQLRLLKAIAHEHVVAEPMGGRFISAHHLKTASSVRASLRFLTDNELCYKADKGYIVYDRFLGFWLDSHR